MEENENVEEVQSVETAEEQVEQPQDEQPQEEVVEQESPVSYKDDGTIVLDMNKVNELEDAVQKQNTDEVPVRDESGASEEVREENVEATNEKVAEQSVQEEVSNTVDAANAAIDKAETTGQALPENIQKLVDFVNDTGGSVEDYVKLNRNYDEMDNLTALNEYYRSTKPHLDEEERQFLMDENFSFDEEVDEEKEIRKKKIALKEQVAEAKAYLDGQKSKYYDEIKAGSNLTAEQQEAIQFFNQYNEDAETQQQLAKERSDYFINETNQVLNDNFKGFEYNVDGKKLNVKVPNPNEVARKQSDINNFINKFLNKDNTIKDVEGYHKALYAAMNPDVIARHFYEQGKADAIQSSVANAKNVNMNARQSFSNESTGGIKVRAVEDNTPSFKFKKRN
tara:strand:+ start:878 stop:2062 length:1185 start_codon:yes stop_codon:yes gene_type:complete